MFLGIEVFGKQIDKSNLMTHLQQLGDLTNRQAELIDEKDDVGIEERRNISRHKWMIGVMQTKFA